MQSHLVNILDSFLFDTETFHTRDGEVTLPKFYRIMPYKENTPHSVVINEYFESGSSGELKDRGDGYMFLCGFYPEYVIKRKSSPGLPFYLNKARECYEYALSIVQRGEGAGFLNRLSDNLEDNVNTLINMQEKIQGREVVLDPEVYQQLQKHTGYKSILDNIPSSNNTGAEQGDSYNQNLQLIKPGKD